ncbi:MAG TPA: hypothetical protein VK484_06130 [Ferruginibacter sp.]|nr:hypothetical protein [Ferruginibacter sp.]
MPPVKKYIIFLSLILLTFPAAAQNITGTWEGDMGDEQFLQLNIIQNGDKLCGYTWDYIKRSRSSFCKAYFEGYYYKKNNEWILTGTSFFENSGSHSLMRLKFTINYATGRGVLEGISTIKASLMNFFGLGAPDSIFLVKVSSRPQQIIENMRDCFLEEQKPKGKPKPKIEDTVTVPIVKTKPVDPIVKMSPPPPVITKTDSVQKPVPFKRKNTEQSHIEVNVKNITLNVYDNAMIDNDTVSIFYNGRLLISHQRLSEKPIVINLELNEKQTRHEIIMFAENLGSIPPNTALIVIYAGDKRYELFSSASLEENAVLVFDYKPKATEKQ